MLDVHVAQLHDMLNYRKWLQKLSQKGKEARSTQIHSRTTGAISFARKKDEFVSFSEFQVLVECSYEGSWSNMFIFVATKEEKEANRGWILWHGSSNQKWNICSSRIQGVYGKDKCCFKGL